MRKIFILGGFLLLAGAAHAQGSISTGGGLNSNSGITSYRVASMRCDAVVDPRSSQVTSAKNDGKFQQSTFASYDEAIEIGQLAMNAKPPMLGEVARKAREQKRNAGQTAILIVEQDQYGRMITTSQPN